MLSKISWSSFLWVLVPAIISYYLYVFIVYFRKEIFSVSAGRKIMAFRDTESKGNFQAPPKAESSPNFNSNEIAEANNNSFTLIHELLEDLKILFITSAKNRTVKEELIQSIRSKLKEYSGIKEKEIRDDITEHISMEVRDKCNIDFEPEDIKLIWEV
jgi:hypothetical protein